MPILILSSLMLLEANVSGFYNSAGISTSREDRGNNSILFYAYNIYLNNKSTVNPFDHDRTMSNATNTAVKGYYDATPFLGPKTTKEQIGGFSIDNMTALYYISKKLNLSLIKRLPLFKWNGRIWWHPNGWLIFLCTKYSFLKYFPPFYIAIAVMALWAATREKTRTTGFLLWVIRLEMLNMKLIENIFHASIPWFQIENAFIYYHSMGYTNQDNLDNHPNVVAARRRNGFIEIDVIGN